jgi:hypothetical protein
MLDKSPVGDVADGYLWVLLTLLALGLFTVLDYYL